MKKQRILLTSLLVVSLFFTLSFCRIVTSDSKPKSINLEAQIKTQPADNQVEKVESKEIKRSQSRITSTITNSNSPTKIYSVPSLLELSTQLGVPMMELKKDEQSLDSIELMYNSQLN